MKHEKMSLEDKLRRLKGIEDVESFGPLLSVHNQLHSEMLKKSPLKVVPIITKPAWMKEETEHKWMECPWSTWNSPFFDKEKRQKLLDFYESESFSENVKLFLDINGRINPWKKKR